VRRQRWCIKHLRAECIITTPLQAFSGRMFGGSTAEPEPTSIGSHAGFKFSMLRAKATAFLVLLDEALVDVAKAEVAV